MNVDRYHNYAHAHKVCNVPFIADCQRAHVLNLMFIRKARPHLLNNREIRTRAPDAPLFLVNVPRCEAYKRSVRYHGSVGWKNLDVNTRNTDSFLLFKFNRKKDMLQPLKNIEAVA